MELKDIYTQLILEESRNTQNRRELAHCTHKEAGHNPSCGDEIVLQLEVEGDLIRDASFVGEGCAISQASASMMIDLIKGRSLREAGELVDRFLALIRKDIEPDDELEEMLGDAIALKNISNMPARVKCAVLTWHTLRIIIEKMEEGKKVE